MFTQGMFDVHIRRADRPTRKAVDKAIAAGVPWITILGWLIEYGPMLAKKLADLLELFKKEREASKG